MTIVKLHQKKKEKESKEARKEGRKEKERKKISSGGGEYIYGIDYSDDLVGMYLSQNSSSCIHEISIAFLCILYLNDMAIIAFNKTL